MLALGLSGGFMEPLESTSIHLIQTAIARIMTHFPDRSFSPATIDFFNQRTLQEFKETRDFLILHYKATQREDSEFWKYCKNMDIPETLQQRIQLYEDMAHVYRDGHELFGAISWFAVMHGQGLKAKSYHPNVNMMPASELEKANVGHQKNLE